MTLPVTVILPEESIFILFTPAYLKNKTPAVSTTDQFVPRVVVPEKVGLEIVGLAFKTTAPVPLEVVTPVPPLATGRVPVTLVVKFAKVVEVVPVPPLAIGKVPVTPVVSGSPVQLVNVPEEGVPRTGVVRVGLVDKTTLPVPVEVVTPVPPLATGKVPVTPVVKGNPVQLVKVPEEGVPKTGVTSVGLVDNTVLPDPVEVVTPVPPLATGKVPVTPVVRGSPVQLVKVPEEGVPRTGVVSVGLFSVGLVSVLLVSVSVPANVDNVPVVGKVTEVKAVEVNVVANAPDVVRLPPSVIVLLVFATPVPPFAPSNTPDTSDVLMSIASQLVFVPSDLRYLPLALVWLGAKALNAALAVTCPVPPLAIANVPVIPLLLVS